MPTREQRCDVNAAGTLPQWSGYSGTQNSTLARTIPAFRQDCPVQTRLGSSPVGQIPAWIVRVRAAGPAASWSWSWSVVSPAHHGVGVRELVGGFLQKSCRRRRSRARTSAKAVRSCSVGRALGGTRQLALQPQRAAPLTLGDKCPLNQLPALVATATTTPRSTPTAESGQQWTVGASIRRRPAATHTNAPSFVRVAERITTSPATGQPELHPPQLRKLHPAVPTVELLHHHLGALGNRNDGATAGRTPPHPEVRACDTPHPDPSTPAANNAPAPPPATDAPPWPRQAPWPGLVVHPRPATPILAALLQTGVPHRTTHRTDLLGEHRLIVSELDRNRRPPA